MAFQVGPFQTNFQQLVAAAVARSDGGYWVSLEEWKRYLEKLNEYQIQRMAERVADKTNLRQMILEQLRPSPVERVIERTPETKIEPLRRDQKPVYRLRQINVPPDPAIRRRIAVFMVEVRKRAKKIKKRRRDEEAILLSLYE